MPFFGDDFWESERVAAMDDSALGLYQWLLWRQFKHGPLPPVDVLKRIPNRWTTRFDRLWRQVADCFEVLEDGRLENPRCRGVREEAVARSNRARTNGRNGGRPTANPEGTQNKPSGLARSNPEQSSERTVEKKREQNQNPPTPRKRGGAASAAVVFSIPQSLDTSEFRELWATWIEYRREKGAKHVVKAVGGAQQLAACAEMGLERSIAALKHAMSMGWIGMREPDAPRNGHTPAGTVTMRDILAGKTQTKPRDVRAEVVREPA